ncbi:AAA family ATPase [Nocardioides acrostichi]|uniref:MoxR family ATPase n=1 Tax=Nocardioides acrostichi TaxID=2784339 RepID=A0A930V242_9ACTN|nr:MoxR family ATPase [Nocardioides acrostichi]MBF4164007.1 MoxR family ATPase [Nocardioides acrostichi]
MTGSHAASAQSPPSTEELDQAAELTRAVSVAFRGQVVGQGRLLTSMLVALMTEGHVLLESVPGLAKTLASSTLAKAVAAQFSRIQCTPDLLPSDIVGTQVYDPRHHVFETQLGPVHANIVLLDEINRASAKTQSAMLEAMQERQTSIAGQVHPLPRPFMVLATQNPIDDEGTYVLPQAQMDRFLLKEVLDYPSPDDETAMLDRIGDGRLGGGGGHGALVSGVIQPADVLALQELTSRVYVDASVKRYIVELVAATRDAEKVVGPEIGAYVETGASPRGSIAFFAVARALAVLAGRDHVIPEDVRELRHSVLRHRIRLTFDALADRVQPETVIDAVFAASPTP